MQQIGVRYHSLYWYNDLLPMHLNSFDLSFACLHEIDLSAHNFRDFFSGDPEKSKQFDYANAFSNDKVLLISKSNRLILLYTISNGEITSHRVPSEVFQDIEWLDFDVTNFSNQFWIGILYKNNKVAYFSIKESSNARSMEQILIDLDKKAEYKRITLMGNPGKFFLVRQNNEIHSYQINLESPVVGRYTKLVGEKNLTLANTIFFYDDIRKSFIFPYPDRNRIYEYQINGEEANVICGSGKDGEYREGAYALDVTLSDPKLPVVFRPQLSNIPKRALTTLSKEYCDQGFNDLPNLLLFYDSGRNELRKVWRFPKVYGNYSRHNNIYTLMGHLDKTSDFSKGQDGEADLLRIQITGAVKCIRVSQTADLAVLCDKKVIIVTSPFSAPYQKMKKSIIENCAADS